MQVIRTKLPKARRPVAFVFLVSCVAVLANRAREVGICDGGLFEAKK